MTLIHIFDLYMSFPPDLDLTANIWKNTWESGGAHHLHDTVNDRYKVRFDLDL